MLIYYWI